jgi:hypothetical protein
MEVLVQKQANLALVLTQFSGVLGGFLQAANPKFVKVGSPFC